MDSARCRGIWHLTSRAFRISFRSGPVLCLEHLVLNLSGLKRLRWEHLAQETVTASLHRAYFRRKHQGRYEQMSKAHASAVSEFEDLYAGQSNRKRYSSSTEPDMHTRQTLSFLLQWSLPLPKQPVSTCGPWQPHLNLLISLLWG